MKDFYKLGYYIKNNDAYFDNGQYSYFAYSQPKVTFDIKYLGEIFSFCLIITGCRIASVDDTTLNILFCLEDGHLIPASEDLITDMNQTNRTITINLPEGILEL